MTKKTTAVDPNTIYTLEECAALARIGVRVMERPFQRGLIKCGRGSSVIGFRTTGRALLEWIEAGMPGIEADKTSDDVVDEQQAG